MRSAGTLVVAVWAAVGVVAAQRGAPADLVPLSVALPDNPTAGARLFVRKGCVRCHALGHEEARLGPDLGRIHLPGTALDLAGAFWNHALVMREKMRDLKIQAPEFDRGEMADLLAFLTAYRYYLAEVGEPGDPAAGRTVFREKGCAGCHGEPGAWDKPGPSLERYRGRVSAIILAQAMWNHGREMAAAMRTRGVPWPKFAGREMGDLLAYLQSGTSGASVERVYFEPGSPRRGREIFTSKGCIVCHPVSGVGGRGGPDLGLRGRDLIGSVATIAGLMWNHSQGMFAEFTRRGVPPVTFSGQEMADVIAYLYFVNYATVRGSASRGAALFREKCGTCHSVGGGRRVGPDLAAARGLDDPIAIFAAMWNHAPRMEQELKSRGLVWPRLMPGDAADLTAFLVTTRAADGGRKAGGREP